MTLGYEHPNIVRLNSLVLRSHNFCALVVVSTQKKIN
jgi:hypothetical protein